MHKKKKTFDDFHISTWAKFAACPTPEREPDYVSPSHSCYWDLTSGVVRASNHWVGHNGCEEVASCIWLLDGDELPFRAFASGYCAYDDFEDRGNKLLQMYATERDLNAAMLMICGNGVLASTSWEPVFGAWQPPWAFRYFRRSLFVPPLASHLFISEPAAKFVVSAPMAKLNEIVAANSI